MKKTILIWTLIVAALAGFVVYFDLAPGVAATTTTLTQGKETQVGGLPMFVTFDVTSDDGVATIKVPAGFVPDHIFSTVRHTSGSLQTSCEWYRGMLGTGDAITISNAGVRAYATTGGFSVGANASTDYTEIDVGTDCQANTMHMYGWAARYAQ